MEAKLIQFGEIEIDGERYDKDVVIDGGRIRKRAKKPSKPYKGEYGHTPLSAKEALPWAESGGKLIVGTGVHGMLPITPEVRAEAERRGVELVAMPTGEACEQLASGSQTDIHAVLHVTC